MKAKPNQNSLSNLKIGLQITKKAYQSLSNSQWVGKFAHHQNRHLYPPEYKKKSKISQIFVDNIAKFRLNQAVCGLCLVEKDKSQMETLCQCQHRYCYSCLNSYAISKIQQLAAIKCPQKQCKQQMLLTSNIFRYLPDSIKLKYLENKHRFALPSQSKIQQLCQRCLYKQHEGECKYMLSPSNVQQSFNHRLCPRCNVQIRLTQGKRKVICNKCQEPMCYICGTTWDKEHICSDSKTVQEKQKQLGYRGCDCCDQVQCCTTCSNALYRNCGQCCQAGCCQLMFQCQQPSIGCCLWNIFSIPVRILLTVVLTLAVSLMFTLFSAILMVWIILCMIISLFYQTWAVIFQQNCPYSILLFLAMPFVFIYATGVVIKQTSQSPMSIMGQLCECYCSLMGDLWVRLSPAKCQY